MKRGDIVIVRQPGTPASKARPYVVIQRDITIAGAVKVTGCPITSHLTGRATRRPFVLPSDANGLRSPSEIEIDWIYTHPVDCVGEVIGRVDRDTLKSVDHALRNWLEL